MSCRAQISWSTCASVGCKQVQKFVFSVPEARYSTSVTRDWWPYSSCGRWCSWTHPSPCDAPTLSRFGDNPLQLSHLHGKHAAVAWNFDRNFPKRGSFQDKNTVSERPRVPFDAYSHKSPASNMFSLVTYPTETRQSAQEDHAAFSNSYVDYNTHLYLSP